MWREAEGGDGPERGMFRRAAGQTAGRQRAAQCDSAVITEDVGDVEENPASTHQQASSRYYPCACPGRESHTRLSPLPHSSPALSIRGKAYWAQLASNGPVRKSSPGFLFRLDRIAAGVGEYVGRSGRSGAGVSYVGRGFGRCGAVCGGCCRLCKNAV